MCNSNRRCDPCQLIALLPSSLSAYHAWWRRRRCAVSPPAAVVVTHTLALSIAVCTVSDLTSALRRGTTHLVRTVCCQRIFHGLRCKCGCFLHGGTIYPINNIFRRPYLSGCWQCLYFVGNVRLFVRMILLFPICFFSGSFAGREQ